MFSADLILINKFAIKAKSLIGQVSIRLMMTDEAYQVDTLLKAVFSNNPELQDLSKLCSSTLNIDSRYLDVAQHYIESKTLYVRNIDRLKILLAILIKILVRKELNSESYRESVNHFLHYVEDKEREYCLVFIREFYKFLYKEFSLERKSVFGISVQSIKDDELQNNNLQNLWSNVGADQPNEFEALTINAYLADLRIKNFDLDHIKVREGFVKILTIELRAFEMQDGNAFRKAIDAIQQVIIHDMLKEQFAHIAREFYPHWLQRQQGWAN